MLGARRTRPLTAPRPSRSSACATRHGWPNASSPRSTRGHGNAQRYNRNVAGELEHRWELALRELRQAEEAPLPSRAERATPETLSTKDREGFVARGPQLPALWQQIVMTWERRKALLQRRLEEVDFLRA